MDQSQPSSRRGKTGSAPQPLPPQHLAPLAYTVDEACLVARVGRNKLYLAIQSGALRARKLDAKTLILRDDLHDWLKSLPEFAAA